MAIEKRHYPQNRIAVCVDLFGRDRLNLTAERNWKISDIYTEVCDYLAIPESRLFGFAKKLDFGFAFLDPETRLSSLEKKSPSGPMKIFLPLKRNKYFLRKSSEHAETVGPGVILIYLRVRYYIPNQCLRGRVVRHLYYEQLQLNVLNYGILCSDETYFQLASLSIKLNMLNKRNSRIYKLQNEILESIVKLSDHFPQFMIDNYGSDYLYDNIPSLIAPLNGQSRESVEWRFIRLASDASSDFNLHLYPVSLSDPSLVNNTNSSTFLSSASLLSSPAIRVRRSYSGLSSILKTSGKGTFWLGIGPNGFEFHEEDEDKRITHLNSLPWVKIDKLSRKHSSFLVHLNSGKKLTFYTCSPQEAQHLFVLSSQLHEHQTIAHLSSQQSARQLEQQDRLQYNESYVYCEGEVVVGSRLHGNPDVTMGDKLLVETTESPLFPRIAVTPSHDASDSGVVKDEESSQHQEHRETAYI